jgi:alcohol dehydrogenase class IV
MTLAEHNFSNPLFFCAPSRIILQAPLVAIPTTAGTGSEITSGAILIDPNNATKIAVMGNDLRPFMAIIDPELTFSCPPKVTADAGLDAVHGLAYGLAGLTHHTHGSTNAVFLPYVMASLIDTRQPELSEIGRMAGSVEKEDLGLARDAVRLTKKLVERVGLASNLAQLGVTTADLQRLIDDGLAVTRLTKAFAHADPPAAYQQIVEYAFSGTLFE